MSGVSKGGEYLKILLAPDSFKGALSAPDAARAMSKGLRRVWPDCECVHLPVADGGEGTLDALLDAAAASVRRAQTVSGPTPGTTVSASWGLLDDGATAVVELAQAAGLTFVPVSERDPLRATTYGVGELICAALARPDVRHLIIGLGGSATNDGGAGLLAACGIGLLDEDGKPLSPGGAALARLARVTTDSLRFDPARVRVSIATDVSHPLTGPHGASATFGPQKGATPADVALLDVALAHFADVLALDPTRPGLGAAGGTTAGLLYLFPHAALRPGIDLVLDALNFDTHLRGADLVLTGEGRLDGQTAGGKAVSGVARRARAAGVPCAALVGSIGADIDGATLTRLGIAAVMPLAPGPCSLAEAMAQTAGWLADAAERAARWVGSARWVRSTTPASSV